MSCARARPRGRVRASPGTRRSRSRDGRRRQVPGEETAAAPDLEDHASALAYGFEERQDPGRAIVGMEPEPAVVHEGEIPPVVGVSGASCGHPRVASYGS